MVFIKNNYNELAEVYNKSDLKPDKAYSILPTVLTLVGDLQEKTVLDLGCGDGFFTKAFAEKNALKVAGIDNSKKQIKLAKMIKSEKIEYQLKDIFNDKLPRADIINSPFVINYVETTERLGDYFKRLYDAFNFGGKLVLVYDLPSGQNLAKFGAKKIVKEDKDESEMTIELYNQGKLICSLKAIYFTENTIQKLLQKVGFKNITTHFPIISEEGIQKFGEKFWEGYIENSELGYLTAEKV